MNKIFERFTGRTQCFTLELEIIVVILLLFELFPFQYSTLEL